MSATPEQIAERLVTKAEQHRFAATQSSLGDGSPYNDAAELFENTAALIRAQAERVRVLEIREHRAEVALNLIAEMDGDQPARSDWDMVRIARAALKAAP